VRGSESLQIRNCALANISLPSGVPSFGRSKKLPRVRNLLASSHREAGAALIERAWGCVCEGGVCEGSSLS